MAIESKLIDAFPILGFFTFCKRNKASLNEIAGEDLEKYPLSDKIKILGNVFYHFSCLGTSVVYSAQKLMDSF